MAAQLMNIRKTRILFVLIQLDAGGSERVVLDLACNLDQDKFEVYVAAFKGGALEAAFKEVCKGVFVVLKKPGIDIGAMLQISSIVKKNNIDVVNAHHYMPCFYSYPGTCVMHRKRLIYTEHSVPEVTDTTRGKHKKILNFMLNRIDTVIGVSQEITDTFIKHYPKYVKKFRMVLNGVDIDKFRCPGKRELTRLQFGFQQDHFVIGMVANFRRVKNHACLIRAVKRLNGEVPEIKVLLVGTGFPGDPENTEDDIKAMVRDLGLQDRVVFAGYQSDIPMVLSALDCFCLPSFSEGLPVSVLEAMAAGLVVVGSDVSGINEIVEHAVSGYLFEVDNHIELSQLLSLVYSQPYDYKMNGTIKNTIERGFDLKSWVAECEKLLLNEK